MVFDYHKEKSLYDDDDEFGVQEYRSDSSYIFNANRTPVRIIRFNEEKAEQLSGDFLGVTTASSYPDDDYENIEINIMSTAPDTQDISEHGYGSRGLIIYECFANWDLKISNKDVIQFLGDYGLDTKKGEQFRVKLDDSGMYQGQYTRKQFTITKIAGASTKIADPYIIDESGNFIVDDEGNYIVPSTKIADHYIIDENGNFIVDENGNYIVA